MYVITDELFESLLSINSGDIVIANILLKLEKEALYIDVKDFNELEEILDTILQTGEYPKEGK